MGPPPPPSMRSAYPPWIHSDHVDGHGALEGFLCHDQQMIAPPSKQEENAHANPVQANFQLQVVQYNPKSVSIRHAYGTVGRKKAARARTLQEQFVQSGAQVIGIQESRNKGGVRKAGPFVVFASGTSSEGLGCEHVGSRRTDP